MDPQPLRSYSGEPFADFCHRTWPLYFAESQANIVATYYEASESVLYFAFAQHRAVFPQVIRDLGERRDQDGIVWRSTHVLSDEEIPFAPCPPDSFLRTLSPDVIRNSVIVKLWREIAAADEFWGTALRETLDAIPIGGRVQIRLALATMESFPLLPDIFGACKSADGSFKAVATFTWPSFAHLAFFVSQGANLAVFRDR